MQNNPIIIRCAECRTLNNVPAEKLANRPFCGQCKKPLAVPNHPVTASAANFDRELNDWPEFALVELWAKWCGYCRTVEPIVNDVAAWRTGKLKVLKIDVDAEPALARRFSVKATPTFILYRNGKQLARMDGAPKEKIDLVQWIDHAMNH
jgi:thioredoxin 2